MKNEEVEKKGKKRHWLLSTWRIKMMMTKIKI